MLLSERQVRGRNGYENAVSLKLSLTHTHTRTHTPLLIAKLMLNFETAAVTCRLLNVSSDLYNKSSRPSGLRKKGALLVMGIREYNTRPHELK